MILYFNYEKQLRLICILLNNSIRFIFGFSNLEAVYYENQYDFDDCFVFFKSIILKITKLCLLLCFLYLLGFLIFIINFPLFICLLCFLCTSNLDFLIAENQNSYTKQCFTKPLTLYH